MVADFVISNGAHLCMITPVVSVFWFAIIPVCPCYKDNKCLQEQRKFNMSMIKSDKVL